MRCWQLALQEFDFKYKHIKGENNVVADAFSRLRDHNPMEGVAKTERLAALFMSGNRMGPPTVEQSSKGNSGNPVAY